MHAACLYLYKIRVSFTFVPQSDDWFCFGLSNICQQREYLNNLWCPASVYHRRDRERDLDPVTLVSLLRSLIDCNNGGRTVFKPPWLHTAHTGSRAGVELVGASVIYTPWSEVIAEARALALPIQPAQQKSSFSWWIDSSFQITFVLCVPPLHYSSPKWWSFEI